ncbi:MAG: MoaD/ThiS family protein [archaeon YNP-WB-062]|nr:MoaD/ThiS family protein [Candidatus Culexarchaeum yellowstonense]
MKVTILFFSSFRENLGLDRITLDIDAPLSVRDLLMVVDGKLNGRLMKLISNSDGGFRGDIHFAVNMRRIGVEDLSNVIIGDGDVLAVMPAPSGG